MFFALTNYRPPKISRGHYHVGKQRDNTPTFLIDGKLTGLGTESLFPRVNDAFVFCGSKTLSTRVKSELCQTTADVA